MLSLLGLTTILLLSSTAWGQQAPEEPSPEQPEAVEEAEADPPAPGEAAEGEAAEGEASPEAPPASEDGAKAGGGESATAEAPAAEEDTAQEDSEAAVEEGEASEDVAAAVEESGDDTSLETEASTEETGNDEEDTEEDEEVETLPPKPSIPGSPRPPALGLAPEAPPVGPAPGAQTPSFGTPLGPDGASLIISGNIAAWQTSGIGRKPVDAGDDYGGPIVHTPPNIAGRIPFWRQAEISLFITYGTPQVQATVNYFAFAGNREYQGFVQPSQGPTFSQGYLTLTPNPIGNLQLRMVVGAFSEVYAGPGQWGWGIFGPLMAFRGYGESTHAEFSASPKLKLTASAGIMGVPGVPEDFPRGNWTGWTEVGVSTFVHHGHVGFNYGGQYIGRLHYAQALGTDERVYLTPENTLPSDGRMNVFAAEGHVYGNPWGHLGVSAGLWDLKDAIAVHDGLFWGIKWTKGAQDMINEYIGPNAGGTGQVAAVSAEFNTSLARIAWHPRPFDGRSPDIRLNVAAIGHRTLSSDDPNFDGTSGFLVGTEIEYQMFRHMSLNLRSYGENRAWYGDRWAVYNVAPGLAFRSDWQSPDRIELWYSRQFYTDIVDNNPVLPLDRHVVALGVFLGF